MKSIYTNHDQTAERMFGTKNNSLDYAALNFLIEENCTCFYMFRYAKIGKMI